MDSTLLTVAEMAEADRLTIAAGTPGIDLMERAGEAVAAAVANVAGYAGRRPVVILCGPGNNGGDGYVAARRLAAVDWPVRVASLVPVDALKGDAALAAGRWGGPVEPLRPDALDGAEIVVDALFGAGLSRAVDGVAADCLAQAANRRLPIIAVDVPSGIHGDSGRVMGTAVQATRTVTFFRLKQGHALMPGRELCGRIDVADIGIPASVLSAIRPRASLNAPALWQRLLPLPTRTGHKYDRGHVAIFAGDMPGAARLAARAARRAGAGLVTVAASAETKAIIAADWPGTIVADRMRWNELMADSRITTAIVGSGGGDLSPLLTAVDSAVAARKTLVLDADILRPDLVAMSLPSDTVLTPHGGEFARMFPDLGAVDSKAAASSLAAARLGVTIVHKGPDTVVASADGSVIIDAGAPPDLATAGTGDVLAGLMGGLTAQGMDAALAAAAAVHIAGVSAAGIGAGLVAEDVIDGVPAVLRGLRNGPSR